MTHSLSLQASTVVGMSMGEPSVTIIELYSCPCMYECLFRCPDWDSLNIYISKTKTITDFCKRNV